jgi:hypothetical protein
MTKERPLIGFAVSLCRTILVVRMPRLALAAPKTCVTESAKPSSSITHVEGPGTAVGTGGGGKTGGGSIGGG